MASNIQLLPWTMLSSIWLFALPMARNFREYVGNRCVMFVRGVV